MNRAAVARLSYLIDSHSTLSVLEEVAIERANQDARFGPQDILGETGGEAAGVRLLRARGAYEAKSSANGGPGAGWAEILDEECCEALAETNEAALRAELVQVAACAVGFIEAIDRKRRREAP